MTAKIVFPGETGWSGGDGSLARGSGSGAGGGGCVGELSSLAAGRANSESRSKTLKVRPNFRSILVTQVAIFLESLVNDFIELGG